MTKRPTAREQGSQPLPQDSDWLFPFLPALRALGPRLLELGCGPGLDSATLCASGFEVTAFDRAPLERARRIAPSARLFRADLGRPLPLRSAVFDSALASLSLHYLPWPETRAAFAEVQRVLRPGAPFLFRVNATDDIFHGAGEGEELAPNFFRAVAAYHSETKRFFDEAAVLAAAAGLFSIEQLEHVTIHRYEHPKQAWLCLARAADPTANDFPG